MKKNMKLLLGLFVIILAVFITLELMDNNENVTKSSKNSYISESDRLYILNEEFIEDDNQLEFSIIELSEFLNFSRTAEKEIENNWKSIVESNIPPSDKDNLLGYINFYLRSLVRTQLASDNLKGILKEVQSRKADSFESYSKQTGEFNRSVIELELALRDISFVNTRLKNASGSELPNFNQYYDWSYRLLDLQQKAIIESK